MRFSAYFSAELILIQLKLSVSCRSSLYSLRASGLVTLSQSGLATITSPGADMHIQHTCVKKKSETLSYKETKLSQRNKGGEILPFHSKKYWTFRLGNYPICLHYQSFRNVKNCTNLIKIPQLFKAEKSKVATQKNNNFHAKIIMTVKMNLNFDTKNFF